MTQRLDWTTARHLPAMVARPLYDRAAVTPGIVHFGLGAFHRAHQAVMTDGILNDAGGGGWGIIGVSPRATDTRDALALQGGLYTVVERDGAGGRARVIGAISETLVAPEDPGAVLERLTRPTTRIVSITVTEKGYLHNPATGALNEDHPDIRHDLGATGAPRTLPGFLIEALIRRRDAGVAPFTVLSCDNLANNGAVTARVLRRFADMREPGLGAWVEDWVACPNTMVDRIVPATTDADRQWVAETLGVVDAWPVVTEPFSQWVIEDRFPLGRPAWETQGAQVVGDVHPFETMKLRLLNASHSAIAYLGQQMGLETVAEVVGEGVFARFITAMMDDEITPTLSLPPGVDLVGYKAALMRRFANPALKHRTAQIAMDGSQKLPPRLLGTIADRRAQGTPFERLALTVAAWMRHLLGTDEAGRTYTVNDPLADQLTAIARAAGPVADRLAPALMEVTAIFGETSSRDPVFVAAITNALDELLRDGARACLARLAG